MKERIIILDFGSQYTQLIARRIRELNVFCEIYPYNSDLQNLEGIKGVILSGSPFSVNDANAPFPHLENIKGKVPLLGVCYGAQFLAQQAGGKVMQSNTREYGRANLSSFNAAHPLFKGLTDNTQVWMSHGDTILEVPDGFSITASTETVNVAGFVIDNEASYGIQFHPEVFHTTEGATIISNFILDICGCAQSWTPASFIETTILDLKTLLKDDKVILGISGGVDSSVAAVLLSRAIGDNLHCIFVNNGLLRKNEYSQVLDSLTQLGLNIKGVDASDLFLANLKGISDPEGKRKAIGKTFIDVFDQASHTIEGVLWLAQGTIYPDVIESQSVNGPSATIKSHHNVGGLPDYMKLKIVEPLKTLFKDEVRRVGTALGLPHDLLSRHPFPGPGLAIRILGDITPEKVEILQEVDAIFINGLHTSNLYKDVWQAGAILLPVQSVGVMGDERTYENVVALRAVSSTDGMTADWSHLPYEFLAKVSNEIINQVKGVNRVVYDISSKPPATIEWE